MICSVTVESIRDVTTFSQVMLNSTMMKMGLKEQRFLGLRYVWMLDPIRIRNPSEKGLVSNTRENVLEVANTA